MKQKIDQYCRACVNRKIDFQNAQYGIICGVTEKEPDFDPTCPHFEIDKEQALKAKNRGIVEPKTRAINQVIDFVLILILFVIVYPLVFAASFLMLKGFAGILVVLLFLLLGFMFTTVAYYMVMEGVFNKTVGKFITGTRVVTTDHQKPPFKNIAIRSLLRLIPFAAFLREEGSPIFFHDKKSGTIVVKG